MRSFQSRPALRMERALERQNAKIAEWGNGLRKWRAVRMSVWVERSVQFEIKRFTELLHAMPSLRSRGSMKLWQGMLPGASGNRGPQDAFRVLGWKSRSPPNAPNFRGPQPVCMPGSSLWVSGWKDSLPRAAVLLPIWKAKSQRGGKAVNRWASKCTRLDIRYRNHCTFTCSGQRFC